MSQQRRVRITSPQTRIALSRGHRPAQHLVPLPVPGTEDEAGDARARELFARQRRLAARTLGVLGALLFGLSGLLGALPALDRVTVAGVPASWLLVTTVSYPLLLLIAVCHVRGAERLERAARAGRRAEGGAGGTGRGADGRTAPEQAGGTQTEEVAAGSAAAGDTAAGQAGVSRTVTRRARAGGTGQRG